jgi:hypothetical protein
VAAVTVLSEENDAGPSNTAGVNSSAGSVFFRLTYIAGTPRAFLGAFLYSGIDQLLFRI